MDFIETSPDFIFENYPSYVHPCAQYFRIDQKNKKLCYYGVIKHSDKVCEAFLMFKSFNGKVLTKQFFISLFDHCFSLGFKEVYTWTQWDRLARLFEHFQKIGIVRTYPHIWDKDETKFWFVKRI